MGSGRPLSGVQRSLDTFIDQLNALVRAQAEGGQLLRNKRTVDGDTGYLEGILNATVGSANRINTNSSPSRFKFMLGRSGFANNEPL